MKIAIQGILFDEKSSFLQGAAKAPPEIRSAYHSSSANYFSENGLETDPGVFEDKGDFRPASYFEIESITSGNLQGQDGIISLGGDHSVSYPILKAVCAAFGPVDILHIDAHGDLYDSFDGDTYSHACPFARIMEDKLANRLVQVGIRTLNTHQRRQAEKFGVEIIEMKDLDLKKLPEFKAPLYLSVDIDALDPSCAPGVSHQEPGGLLTRDLLHIIQSINVPVVGADIVEYNPDRDLNRMTAMVCAKIFREILSTMISNQA
ncbi:agmatinase [Muriicola jejuensis]|uniref:Agmatinase n=1 Tax=Muriicola jejuensis TaxID=504488 RepID=A0A6P0UHB7_9FLAO|nr:agmatinase family protein [Muriicola jejuensis]NER11198.1 agmatinase [Muriicola jejuensis]SMP24218.1 agmatinase [Muriicola jejuensis]